MAFIATLDSELAAYLQTLPIQESGDFWQDIPGIRPWHDETMAALTADFADSPHVTKEDHIVPECAVPDPVKPETRHSCTTSSVPPHFVQVAGLRGDTFPSLYLDTCPMTVP